MKLSAKSAILAAIGCAAMVSPAAATTVTMGLWENGNYSLSPSAELAGLLGGYVEGKSKQGDFYGSFCIETDEFFSPGTMYDVSVSSYADGGGSFSPEGETDTISVGTAYLCAQFALGLLQGGFLYGDATWALKLQETIWWLEHEPIGVNHFADLLSSQFADPRANYLGSDVRVFNLTGLNSGTRHQDQVVYVGGVTQNAPIVAVPDGGATLILLGSALLGLGVFRRATAVG